MVLLGNIMKMLVALFCITTFTVLNDFRLTQTKRKQNVTAYYGTISTRASPTASSTADSLSSSVYYDDYDYEIEEEEDDDDDPIESPPHPKARSHSQSTQQQGSSWPKKKKKTVYRESDFPPAPPSPYEIRWHDRRYKLPPWASVGTLD